MSKHMYIDLRKTLAEIGECLPEKDAPTPKQLQRMYEFTLRLQSQELAVIYDMEAFGSPAAQEQRTLVFPAAVPVCGGILEDLIFRANHAVMEFIINILPPLMAALHRLRTLVGCGEHSAVIKYLLADRERLVSGICNNLFLLGKASDTLLYTASKATLSWTFPGVTTVSNTKPWLSQAV